MNNSSININNKEVAFEKQGEQVFCTSLDIARVFEKEHKNVLRSIENTLKDLRKIGTSFDQLNFEPSMRVTKNGIFDKNTKFYKLTKDGFAILAMGFTGTKSLQWKIQFINAFNQMQQLIQREIKSPNEYLTDMMKDIYPNLPKEDYRVDISIKDSLNPQTAQEIYKLSYLVDNRTPKDPLKEQNSKETKIKALKDEAKKISEKNIQTKDRDIER